MWQARLVTEQDNFRAALKWSLQRASTGATMVASKPVSPTGRSTSDEEEMKGVGDSVSLLAGPLKIVPGAELLAVEVSLRLAAALRAYWEWQGHLVEGRGWLDAVLEVPIVGGAGRTALAARAKALGEAARLVCLQNEQSKAVELAEASIALWRQLDDPRGLATAFNAVARPLGSSNCRQSAMLASASSTALLCSFCKHTRRAASPNAFALAANAVLPAPPTIGTSSTASSQPRPSTRWPCHSQYARRAAARRRDTSTARSSAPGTIFNGPASNETLSPTPFISSSSLVDLPVGLTGLLATMVAPVLAR